MRLLKDSPRTARTIQRRKNNTTVQCTILEYSSLSSYSKIHKSTAAGALFTLVRNSILGLLFCLTYTI